MKVWYRTYFSDEILRRGFKDNSNIHETSSSECTGVWVTDRPLDKDQGAVGNAFLTLEVPEEEIVQYERYRPLQEFREFLVPADILNSYGPPKVDIKTRCC